MDLSPASLAKYFRNTFSNDQIPRKAAENRLKAAANEPNFALAVLNLVGTPDVDDHIRSAAALNFKHHLFQRWAPGQDSDFNPIPDDEKSRIKNLIVSLTLSSSPLIQPQLNEALSLICKHDFPNLWPSLLPQLLGDLRVAPQSKNYATVNVILGTANSVFEMFRYPDVASNDGLKYCIGIFVVPLFDIFRITASLIDNHVVSGFATLMPLFESQRLCCQIMYSLNCQGLLEIFTNDISEWFIEFHKYLTVNFAPVESGYSGYTVLDDLRVAVCENLNLYMDKTVVDNFHSKLNMFPRAVWRLLCNLSQNASHDRLAVTAIKFLATSSTRVPPVHFSCLIEGICRDVAFPNLRLRDEDAWLFDMDCTEYIKRDMEGRDLDSRRVIACELLKGIAENYRKQVTIIVSVWIQNLLISYARNPAANWKDRECAIYLVVSLASKKSGGLDVVTDIVDVQSFFTWAIVPELRSEDVNSCPMLKAGALKFFTMFRDQIPKHLANPYLPQLVRFLEAESKVVHSYAAICIDKLLLVKDDGASARYTASDFATSVLVLMTKLFNALKIEKSKENHYIMMCIMRVIGVAEIDNETADTCSFELTSILDIVCKTREKTVFNQYLFESVAVLVRRAFDRDRALMPAFEQRLFPSLLAFLQKVPLEQNRDSANQMALLELCKTYGRSIT
ncbi:CAS [Linum grandiflorum]